MSCPTKGTSNDSSFSWPCCHPESWSGDLEHNTQHGHREAVGRAQVEELEWAAKARRMAGKFWSAQLQFHNTLASVPTPSCWVLPPTSALLPCAGLHNSLLQTQLLSSLLCKLHHGETEHVRWHLFWSTHLTHVSLNNLLLAWHHTIHCNPKEMQCSTGMGFAHQSLLPRPAHNTNYMLIFSNSIYVFFILLL